MTKKSLAHIHVDGAPNDLANVEQDQGSTLLTFNDGSQSICSGVTDFDIDGDLITIYRAIRNLRHRIDFNAPTLNRQGTSTALELVQFWKRNNFFFDVGVPSGNFLTTYRAQNWTDLTTNVALNPQEGETAYLIESQGTRFDVTGLINPYKSGGLWYYNGTEWTNSQQEIAEALGIAIEDIVQIELVNANQDLAIAANASAIVVNSSNIAANILAIAENLVKNEGTVSIHSDVDLSGITLLNNSKLRWNGSEFIACLSQTILAPSLDINNTNVLTDKVNQSIIVQRSVPHKIKISFGWSLNDGAQDFIAVGSFAGQNLLTSLTDNSQILRQEPKDVGGPDPDGRGTNQRHRFTGVFYLTPLAGPQDFILQWAGSANNDLASIWDVSVEIEELVSTINV